MTYLFKLARRLAFARSLPVLLLGTLACSEAVPREFLSPDPGGPPTAPTMTLVIAPGTPALPYDQITVFRAWGRRPNGDSLEVAVNWSATGGQIQSDGTYRGTQPGTHTVTAYAVGNPALSATTAISVSNPGPLFATLSVQPKPVFVYGGARIRFGATARLQSGANTLPTVTWRASGGTISPAGEFDAGLASGTYQVVATTLDGLLSDTATVVIEPAELTELQVYPRVVTLPGGASQDFQVQAGWSDGTSAPPEVVWETAAGTIAPIPGGGGAGPAGAAGSGSGVRFTSQTSPGTYKIVVRHPRTGKSDTASVTITPVLTGIEVGPGAVDLAPGVTQSFQARGMMSDGTRTTVTVSWSATGGTVSGSGLYTAGNTAGTFRVIARTTTGTFADTATVRISEPGASLSRITVSPETGTAPVGGTVEFAASAEWSDGATTLPELTWTATGGSITSFGRWTAPAAPGSYRIVARQTAGTRADTAIYQVVVPPPSLTGLSVSPEAPGVLGGAVVAFSVQAAWTDGGTTVPPLAWTATGGSVTQAGVWTAPNVSGVYRVVASAVDAGLADTAVVTVSEVPRVTLIRLSPRLGALNPGGTLELEAAAKWSDGQLRAVTPVWTATGGTVSMTGLFTAGNLAGQAMVIVTCAGCNVADTARITISDPVVPAPVVTQLVVYPPVLNLAAGATYPYQVAALWSDGSTTVPPLVWTPGGGAMSGMTYTAGQAAGTYQVIVRDAGGSAADTSVVTITGGAPPPPLTVTRLNITPANPMVDIGATLQFAATASMSDGTTTNPAIQWSATGGTISAGGLYTAGAAAGLFVARATCAGCGRTDSLAVTVTTPPPPPGVGLNDRVIFPSPEVEFIVGPQLKAGSSHNPWPWFDQNLIAQGLVHGAAFPVTPAADPLGNDHYINRNYYDLGLVLYTAYYQTGNLTLLAHARKVADSWWLHQQIGGGTTPIPNSMAPRNISLGGLMLRALDGRPEMWPWITTYVREQFNTWVGLRLASPTLYYGVRDGGYMLLYAAWLAKAHPDAAVRAEFRQKALAAATTYYARLQKPDGSWRWTDPDANVSGELMQPFMVGLLLDGMVATHRLTGDATVLTAITRSVENLYTVGYRGNEPVTQKPGATWRGMWYTVYGATCQTGCGRKTLDGGWDTNGIREVRQLNPVILHAFGYAYAVTQDPRFRQWGDEVFAATFGKNAGPFADPYYGLADFREKEYNASYRSSGHYLAWRQGVP